ncbi:glycosyl hydrolase [Puia dinghuensis]|uniref:Glycosyl hydrolase n=2 Tax=Puia dinghuensis TaxID=1792502 RepID=A0A8J2UAF1_9BACT|nr:glycosyl hydrolase [Puia dinghuensis]
MPAQAQNTLPQLGKNSTAEVIAAMTLEEKANLVVGNGFYIPGANFPGMNSAQLNEAQKKVPGASGVTRGVPRLGIPPIVVTDGPAGVHVFNTGKGRVYYATAWPVGTLLASSWDTALVRRVGVAFGSEAKEYGVDIILGPGLNIHRNPLGGRNFEYYSEDPLITGNIAAALVNGIQSNGVGTSIKHFAANNQETDRNSVNTVVSERALREIYLKGFEIAVKQAQPWTVMTSYNLINGVYTSERPDLVTTILKNEWGFKGFVMTDWFGGKDPVAQMKAGNNLLMPGTADQVKKIVDAVKGGQLDEKALDRNVEGILNIVLQSGTFKADKYSDQPDLTKDAQIAREAADESMVLLKNNNNTLPIAANSHIALFGINAFNLIAGGTGSGDVNRLYTVSLAEGLFHAGLMEDGALYTAYNEYIAQENAKHPKKGFFEEFMNPTPPIQEYPIAPDMITRQAAIADIAIISIGRNSGEGTDRKVSEFYLGETEKQLIANVAAAFHAKNKKVIVVLNIAGVTDVTQWEDNADAVLLAWQPGLEGGNAIADILSGKVNPSGKLATTFPVHYDDVPSAKNFPGKEFPEKATTGMLGMKAIPAEVTYEEGIYVGYRYYNTFGVKPAYPFGYGLSYTTFGYSDLKLSSPTFTNTISASITVTNTGKVAGKEVVQLYLTAPVHKLDKPAEELRAFAKTSLLKPGESQTLTFTLTPADLASYNTTASAWIADAGKYTVKIGASSDDIDIKQTATFNLAKDIVAEKDEKTLTPQTPFTELKPVKK